MAMSLDQLIEQVHGEVVVPGDQTYDEARAVHNGMIDKRPSAVLTVANTGDVTSAIRYAREMILISQFAVEDTAGLDLGPLTMES